MRHCYGEYILWDTNHEYRTALRSKTLTKGEGPTSEDDLPIKKIRDRKSIIKSVRYQSIGTQWMYMKLVQHVRDTQYHQQNYVHPSGIHLIQPKPKYHPVIQPPTKSPQNKPGWQKRDLKVVHNIWIELQLILGYMLCSTLSTPENKKIPCKRRWKTVISDIYFQVNKDESTQFRYSLYIIKNQTVANTPDRNGSDPWDIQASSIIWTKWSLALWG